MPAEGKRTPVSVAAVGDPEARVLAGTGTTELQPAAADLDPGLLPMGQQAIDLAGIDIVVNTHLACDHCGGNHPYAGRQLDVQRLVLDDARREDD